VSLSAGVVPNSVMLSFLKAFSYKMFLMTSKRIDIDSNKYHYGNGDKVF
jgi:hypothetical protein